MSGLGKKGKQAKSKSQACPRLLVGPESRRMRSDVHNRHSRRFNGDRQLKEEAHGCDA